MVVELKNVDFKPDFIGQLQFYITAVDETLKKDADNPTIGPVSYTHLFEKAICERVVCLPIYEKMLEEAEIQGYYCKAEVFNGSLKNKEYRSYLVVKIIDKNGELVHENGMETGVLMFYKTLCYSTLFHRVVEIQLNKDENFIKELTDFTEKLKNQVCKIGE